MDDNIIKSIFPSGLHILVVDDDAAFLCLLEMMLLSCHYKVTACSSPISALSILLEQRDVFDLLLADLEMPEMDGYELLKIVKKKLQIPVILMSIDARVEVMIKVIQQGACYFLHKPLSMNLVRNLWTHVVWKKFSDDKEIKRGEKGKAPLDFDSSAPDDRAASKGKSVDDGSNKAKVKQVQEQEEDPATPKKRRIIWTPKLNRKFKDAIDEPGIDESVPSKTAELMNVEGIDRRHAGSHLQKYRFRSQQEKEREQSYLSWNPSHGTMNPFQHAGYMGMGPNTTSGPSYNPLLVPQAATYLTWVNVPGTGNAFLGPFAGSVQPQQVGGYAQQYYIPNCFPCTAFGATYAGSSNPAPSVRKENAVPVSESAFSNANFQAPGTSTPGYQAAGGLAPSGLVMGSNQSLSTNMGQENPGVHEAAGSSRATEEDKLEKFLKEFLEEDDW